MSGIQNLLNPVEKRPCLLDLLPIDVLEKVVRKTLKTFAIDAAELLKYESFRPVLRDAFKILRFAFEDSRVCVSGKHIILGSQANLDVVEQFIRVIKPKIRAVGLQECLADNDTENNVRLRAKFVAECLVQYIPSVRVLRIGPEQESRYFDDAIKVLLSGFGHQMQDIEINGLPNESMPYMPTIASSCVALKRFQFHGYTFHEVAALLPSLTKLVEIDLCLIDWKDGEWLSVISAMKEHCRQLRTIKLDNPLEKEDAETLTAYLSFLCSYGKQLEFANLFSLDGEEVNQFALACPNVSVNMLHGGTLYEHFEALNIRLHTLHLWIWWEQQEQNWRPLGNAFKVCSKLQSLTVDVREANGRIYDGWVPQIFANPFPLLELFHLQGSTRLDASYLELIAKSTCRLKSIALTFQAFDSADLFKPLIETNPNLEKVHFVSCEQCELKKVREVGFRAARMFAKCKNLKMLHIEFGDMQSQDREDLHIEGDVDWRMRDVDFVVSRKKVDDEMEAEE